MLSPSMRVEHGLLAQDNDGNTTLHFAYQQENKLMRFYIRQYIQIVDQSLVKQISNTSNIKGQLPREMHHKLKYDSSDDEHFKKSLKKVGLQE